MAGKEQRTDFRPSFLTFNGRSQNHLQTSKQNKSPKHIAHTMARDLAPDWILQETLAIQAQTAQWFKDKQAEHAGQKPLTLTVLGCGMRQPPPRREAANA